MLSNALGKSRLAGIEVWSGVGPDGRDETPAHDPGSFHHVPSLDGITFANTKRKSAAEQFFIIKGKREKTINFSRIEKNGRKGNIK